MDVLLTNDDGIGSPGFRAAYEALRAVEGVDVTAVAPMADQSAVGRAVSVAADVAVEDHPLGYAVDGTPADCVIAGIEALVPETDLVVAGSNKGANLGAYVLGRSGTVSAAVEAAFFDVPAIAASTYVPTGDVEFHEVETEPGHHAPAVLATAYLVERAPAVGVFDRADYLNVNAPAGDPGDDHVPGRSSDDEDGGSGTAGAGDARTGGRLPMQITRPSMVYDMDASPTDGGVRLHDRIWDQMESGDVRDPPGTDRRAVVEGAVSVSPLTAPHTTERHDALENLAADY